MTASEGNSEWLTRKRPIGPLLDAVDWPVKPIGSSGFHHIEEYEADAGPANYALCIDSAALGIVEAKKLSLGPQNVLVQAERYSRWAKANRLNCSGFRILFLSATNGEVIWFRDVRNALNRSRHAAALVCCSRIVVKRTVI